MNGYNYSDEHFDQLKTTSLEWRAPALWGLLPESQSDVSQVLTIKAPPSPEYAGVQTFVHAIETLYWMHGTPNWDLDLERFVLATEKYDQYRATHPSRQGHTLWAMLRAARRDGFTDRHNERLRPSLHHYHLDYPDAVLEFLHAGMGPVMIVLPNTQVETYLGCIVAFKGRDVKLFASGVYDQYVDLSINDMRDGLLDDMLPSFGLSLNKEPTLQQ